MTTASRFRIMPELRRRAGGGGGRSVRGTRTLRAGASAGAGAGPADPADPGGAFARSSADECRAIDRAGATPVRGVVVRGAGQLARHFGFFRRLRVLGL